MIHIKFKANPGSPDLTFIEVEDDEGYSISAGEWSRQGGFEILSILDYLDGQHDAFEDAAELAKKMGDQL